MSSDLPTPYEEMLYEALEAGAEGKHFVFGTKEQRRYVMRQMLTARHNYRREMKREFRKTPEHPMWNTSPWDHLQIMAEGDMGVWVVPMTTYLAGARVGEKADEHDSGH